MRDLKIASLSADRISMAFPVVQTAFPHLTLDGWQDFAAAMTNSEGQNDNGILQAENDRGVILGLSAFRLARDLQHGTMLTAENLIAIDIVNRESVARALIEALEELAKLRHCTVIHATVFDKSASQSKSWLVGMLTARAYEIEGLRLCKSLSPANGAGG